tara:strand:- start:833 stop:1750 length:918 start_codon:yes stop_codon:yes gene_type:complete
MSLLTTGIVQEFLTTHQTHTPAPYVYSYQVVLSAVGTNTFIVPANCASIGFGLIGGGSAGIGVTDVSGLGAAIFPGGGGGGYAYSLLTVSGGTLTQTAYTYNIGEGGDKDAVAVNQPIPSVVTYYGKSGGTTWFGNVGSNLDTALIRAGGGGGSSGAPPNNPTNLGGGDSLNGGGLANVGQITYVGGVGALGTNVGVKKTGGGGGGAASGGTGNAGANNDGLGNWASGGTAQVGGGGTGGLGFWIENNIVNGKIGGSGTDGIVYGGGGGGCGRYSAFGAPASMRGGSGAQGLIFLDITISVPYFI